MLLRLYWESETFDNGTIMQLTLAYLDASAIEETPLDAWRELFEVVGWPSSLKGLSLSYDALRASFAGDDPPDGLLLALEAIHGLGTEAGRDALLEAMRDQHLDEAKIPAGCGEREFALRLFILQKKDPLVSGAFMRAQIKMQATGEHKAVHEFWGAADRVVKSVDHSKARLAESMAVYCTQHDLGDHIQVEAVEDDGTWVFQVTHSDRTRTPLAIVDGGAARSRIRFRPVHCDVLRYEAAAGRLQIAARRATLVDTYLRLAGEALFEDPTFFVGDAACTLTPLQEKGKAALTAHDLPGVGRAWMTECSWQRGDRRVHRIRSVDCFDDIESLGLPIATEGKLVEVKLKIQVAEKGTRPATISVRLPGKISVTPSRHEPLGHRYLEEIGVRCRALTTPALDLWSLHPWRHPTRTWRALLGDRVDELAQVGALVSVELDSVEHPDTDGATLEVHGIGGGQYYGVGSGDEIPAKSLSATDVEGLELRLDAFGSFLGRQLELPEGQVRSLETNVLDLGPVVLGEYTFRPFYLLGTPLEGLGVRLRTKAPGQQVVLIAPRGRTPCSDLAIAELSHPVPSRRALERALVSACGLEGQVPAIHYAHEGAQLVVDTGHGAIWVDDVKVDGLRPDTHPFKFVELLARESPKTVSSADLSAKLSPNRDDDTTAARHAKRDAKKAITTALVSAGREPIDDPFPSASRGTYRCVLSAVVV